MIYFYDGSKEAFLTAFLLAYPDEDAVLTSGNHQLGLGQRTAFVRADKARAARAEARLLELDKDCMHDLDLLLRSGAEDRDAVAYNYMRMIAAYGAPVRKMLAEDAVIAATESMRRVEFEIHRMHGFLRFLECASGAMYAPISPDNDICDLLVPHFRSRLTGYPFVIHDVRRGKAAVYDGQNTFLAPLEKAEIILSADEAGWQSLWKKYYKSVNLPSRERLRQMRGYMPVRYWKFMPEKSEDASFASAPRQDAPSSPLKCP